jgi:chemotaxis protein CheX
METSNKQYQFIGADNYLMLRLTGYLSRVNEKELFEEFSVNFMDPYPHVIVNCEQASSMESPWFRALMQIKKHATQFNKQVVLIRVSENLKSEIKNQGLYKAFPIFSNLREAQIQLGLVTKNKLDTDFINPFLTATLHVLEVQAKVEAIPQNIYIKKDKDQFFGDISGIIGVVSDNFNGSVVISFPEKTFLTIMTNMLEEECKTLTKEIADGAAELTNMIFGQAKITLNEKGYAIKTAIPSVVTGKDHSLNALTKGPVVVVPFKSNAGDFFIEICHSG